MRKFERFLNVVTSLGAAIVIFGAWQKITHRPLADLFLTAGLLTECAIFLLYAFVPPSGDASEAPVLESKEKPFSVQVPDSTGDELSTLIFNIQKLNKKYSGMLKAMKED